VFSDWCVGIDDFYVGGRGCRFEIYGGGPLIYCYSRRLHLSDQFCAGWPFMQYDCDEGFVGFDVGLVAAGCGLGEGEITRGGRSDEAELQVLVVEEVVFVFRVGGDGPGSVVVLG